MRKYPRFDPKKRGRERPERDGVATVNPQVLPSPGEKNQSVICKRAFSGFTEFHPGTHVGSRTYGSNVNTQKCMVSNGRGAREVRKAEDNTVFNVYCAP